MKQLIGSTGTLHPRSMACSVLAGLTLASPAAIAQEQHGAGADDALRLEAITVAGDKPEDFRKAAGAAHRVDEEILERDEYDDIERVLMHVPGVYIRGEDGYGLRPNIGLRGTTTERSQKISILEDDVPIAPAPYSAPAAYYFPTLTRMTAVEVLKGPPAVVYPPSTVGGALNLVTRAVPHEEEFGADIGVGTDDYRKLHAFYGDSGPRFGWLIEGLRLETDGFKELDGGGDTGFVKHNLMIKARVESEAAARRYQRLELKINYADERSDETYTGLTDADFQLTPYRRYAATQNDRMEWEHHQFALGHLIELTPDAVLRTVAYRHEFARDWTKLNGFRSAPPLDELLAEPNAGLNRNFVDILRGEQDSTLLEEALLVGANDRDFLSQGVQSVMELWLRRGEIEHDFSVGLRYHRDEVERNHTNDFFVMRGGRLVATGEATRTALANRDSAEVVGAHVKDELQIGKLTLMGVLRVDHVQYESRGYVPEAYSATSSQTVVLPGVGAFYQVAPRWGILAGVHRGFVPGGPPGTNGEVEPEKSISYEAGFRYGSDRLQAEAIGFFNDYSNLIGTCAQSTGCSQASAGETFGAGEVDIYGVEAKLGTEWSTETGWRFPAVATYTFTETEFKTAFDSGFPLWGSVAPGDQLPYMPRHQLGISLGAARGQWNIAGNVRYVGEQLEQAGEGGPLAGETLDPYTVVDLAGQYDLAGPHAVYGKIDNVLDETYMISRRPYGARPGKPRTFIVGYKYGF